MGLFAGYAKFKIGQRIFRVVRDMLRDRRGSGAAPRRRRRI